MVVLVWPTGTTHLVCWEAVLEGWNGKDAIASFSDGNFQQLSVSVSDDMCVWPYLWPVVSAARVLLSARAWVPGFCEGIHVVYCLEQLVCFQVIHACFGPVLLLLVVQELGSFCRCCCIEAACLQECVLCACGSHVYMCGEQCMFATAALHVRVLLLGVVVGDCTGLSPAGLASCACMHACLISCFHGTCTPVSGVASSLSSSHSRRGLLSPHPCFPGCACCSITMLATGPACWLAHHAHGLPG